jgi:enediyne biosynthesis protein E4
VRRGLLVTFLGLLASGAAGWIAADRWIKRQWFGERTEIARLRPKYGKSNQVSQGDLDGSSGEKSAFQFEDVASRLGVNFVYDDGAAGQFHIMESVGGGMAVADFDRDGRLDLFFPNGCRLPLNTASETRRSGFYLSGGTLRTNDGSFSDVAPSAGLDLSLYGQGAAAADFNHDGFDDLLVTGFHVLRLFRNQGDGTFVPHPLPLDASPYQKQWWTSTVWFDGNDDGNLDVYVCAYATVDEEHPKDCRRGDVRMHCHPSAYIPEPDLLLKNSGEGRFVDATEELGVRENDGRGLGVAAADFTGTGKPSIYVANDTTEAFLWVREDGSRFSNKASDLGVGLSGGGSTMAGMGVAVGDYDRNGFPDLFVTDFFEAGASLFASFGDVGFVPKSTALGLLAPTRRRLGFGTAFLDADLDGWPDLVAVNGHVSDLTPIGIPYKMKAQAFRNEQGRRFADVSNSAGEFFRKPLLGRGLATGDFNEDGAPDFVVSNIRDQAALLLNRTNPRGAWIGFDFIGRRSARGVRNVKIAVKRGANITRLEQHSGGGFLSSSDPRVIVGLGRDDAAIDEVEVVWPSGTKQTLSKPIANRYHLVVEPMEPAQ